MEYACHRRVISSTLVQLLRTFLNVVKLLLTFQWYLLLMPTAGLVGKLIILTLNDQEDVGNPRIFDDGGGTLRECVAFW